MPVALLCSSLRSKPLRLPLHVPVRRGPRPFGTPGEARERIKLWVANGVDLPIIAGGFDTREALSATLALAPSTF